MYTFICSLFVYSTLLFCLSVDASTKGRPTDDEDDMLDKIDILVEGLRQCYDIDGMNLAVVHNEEIVLTKGYGVKDLVNNEPVMESTMFCIASTSKAFLGALMGQLLHEHSSYTWDSPVLEILGEWFYLSEGYRSAKVTIRDLLGHRVGLAGHETIRMSGFSMDVFVRRLQYLDMVRGFREMPGIIYNNLMYGLATEVATVLAGQPWYEALQERILEPLGMSSTVPMNMSSPHWERFARSYGETSDGEKLIFSLEYPELTYNNVPGLASTAEDMSSWLYVQVNDGRGKDGVQIIDPQVLQESHQPCGYTGWQTVNKPEYPATWTNDLYSMGWSEGHYRGFKTSTHGGDQGGYISKVTIMADNGIGIYSSMARKPVGNANDLLHMYIMDLLMEQQPWIDPEQVCNRTWIQTKPRFGSEQLLDQFSDGQHETIRHVLENYFSQNPGRKYPNKDVTESAVKPLFKYIGIYGHHGYGDLNVLIEDDKLKMTYGPKGLWELTEMMEGVFLAQGRGVFWSYSYVLEFTIDGATASQVKVYFDDDAPPVFVRDLDYNNPPPPPALCD